MADNQFPIFGDGYDGPKMRQFIDQLQNYLRGYPQVVALVGNVPVVQNVNTTPVGNVGAGEDNLMTYTLPANTIKTAGSQLQIQATGTFAANANNKRLRLYIGAATLIDSGAAAINGGSWSIVSTIVRKTDNTQNAITTVTASNGSFTTEMTYSNPNVTLSSNQLIKVTGEATANDDIVQTMMITTYLPNNG